MKTDFFQIVQQTSELLSWYKDIGIQYLDLSEESINTINRWCNKNSTQYANIKSKSSPISYQQIGRNLTEHSTQSNQNHPHLTEQRTHLTEQNIHLTEQHTHLTKHNIDLKNGSNPLIKDQNIVSSEAKFINFDGVLNSKIFFLSETFSYNEPTGELFLNILKAMHLRVENICLCTFKPLDYRIPIPKVRQNIATIRGKVEESISDIKVKSNGLYPQIICSLGDSALKILMGIEYMLTSSRGRFHNYSGVRLMPTYHPSQILNDKNLKRLVWEDMKQIMAMFDINI
ncbi:MAG: hypothetical protein HQK63_06645 [Desulfamplus sp.]|nr:hypothetical protein [Desulfamplus sp.]